MTGIALRLERREAEHAVSICRGFVKKSVIPHLECVRIETSPDGFVSFEATDLNSAVRVRLPVSADKMGVVLVSVARLAAVLKECTAHDVTFKTVRASLVVHCEDAGDFKIRTTDAVDEYPRLPRPEQTGSTTWEIESGVFCELVERSAFAHGVHGQTAMHAVLAKEIKGGHLEFVATNGNRLARMRSPLISSEGKEEALIPPGTLLLAQKHIGELGETPIRLTLSNDVIFFEAPNIVLTSRLINGTFVKYDSVIPKAKVADTVTVSVKAMEVALRRALIFIDDKEKFAVRCAFDGPEVTIDPRNADHGTFKATVPLEGQTREPIDVYLNARNFMDFLKKMDPDGFFTMAIESAKTPVVMTDNPNFLYLQAPMGAA